MIYPIQYDYFLVNPWLDHLLSMVIEQKISDVHIEPTQEHFRIRVRQDGLLRALQNLSIENGLALINRIKILAHLDITEKRMPQDGRLNYEKFIHCDFRVSSCPILNGEKMVIRNLMTMLSPLSLEALGMNERQYNTFSRLIQQPQGLILVTGPTGSGKTLTLYSALQEINQPSKNIVSIEDPVEIKLAGINQTNIQPKIGLNFAHCLRALLRQDPDVLMIGEMRDRETVEIALAAAQTGHLVFSTLHTNSAIESIHRLYQMGVASYNISGALLIIVAQRLLRKLCVKCKKKKDQFYEAVGCEFCLEGYLGRVAVYEFLEFNTLVKTIFYQENYMHQLQNYCREHKIFNLRKHAYEKAIAGLTSVAEITRVLGHGKL